LFYFIAIKETARPYPSSNMTSVRDVISVVTKMYTRVQQTTGKMKESQLKNEIDNVVFLAGAIPFGLCSRHLRDVAVSTCLHPLMDVLPAVNYTKYDSWNPAPVIFFAKLYLASTWLRFMPGVSHSVNVLLQHPEWLNDYGITITAKNIDDGVRYEYDQMLAEFCNNHCLSLVLDDAGPRLPRGRVHTVADSFALYLRMVNALWDDEINKNLAFAKKNRRQPGGDKMVTPNDTAMVYFVTHLVFVANAWGTADFWYVNFTLQVRRRVFGVLCRWFDNIFERDAIQENAEIFYEINYALMYLVDNDAFRVEYEEYDDEEYDDGGELSEAAIEISELPRRLLPLFHRTLTVALDPASDVTNSRAANTNIFMPSVIVGERLTVDYHIHDIMGFYLSEGCRLFLMSKRLTTRMCDFIENSTIGEGDTSDDDDAQRQGTPKKIKLTKEK
jgi:hypothetical protein